MPDFAKTSIQDITRVIRVYNGRKIGTSIVYGNVIAAHEFIYKWSGDSISRIGEDAYALSEGSVLYIPKGEHGTYSVETLRNGEAIDLCVELATPLSDRPFLLSARQNGHVKELFERCHETWVSAKPSRRARTLSIAYEILAELQEMTYDERIPETEKRVMDDALTYIEQHMFDTDFDYKELCAYTAMSYSYMKRVFLARCGMPPSKYVCMRRIQYAKSLLLYPEYSVTRVAQSVGYESLYYFSRVFKRETGISPMEYRRQTR